MASISMIYMVVKLQKNSVPEIGTRVGCTRSKHDTTSAIADDGKMRHFMRV
jgi:hypothetical protein